MRNRPPSLAIQIFFGVHEGGRGRFFQTHGRVDSFFYTPPRLRVLFEKPCIHLQASRLFVATLGDPAANGNKGMAHPSNPRQFSIGELWLCGD